MGQTVKDGSHLEKVGHTVKNWSHCKVWVTLQKVSYTENMGHTSCEKCVTFENISQSLKTGSHLGKWVTFGKMSHCKIWIHFKK